MPLTPLGTTGAGAVLARALHDGCVVVLFIGDQKPQKELIARAEARGYVDHAGRRHPDTALIRLQPLSVRGAIEEAKFLEQAQKDVLAGSRRAPEGW